MTLHKKLYDDIGETTLTPGPDNSEPKGTVDLIQLLDCSSRIRSQ